MININKYIERPDVVAYSGLEAPKARTCAAVGCADGGKADATSDGIIVKEKRQLSRRFVLEKKQNKL